MTQHDQILTDKQVILIQYLVSGKSIAESARVMSIGDKTARRWLSLPHVKVALEQAKAQLFQDVRTRVAQRFEEMVDEAVSTVKRHLELEGTTAIKAAQIVLERVVPIEKAAPAQPVQGMSIDAGLLPFLDQDDLAEIRRRFDLAEARKRDAEQNITPIRKQA